MAIGFNDHDDDPRRACLEFIAARGAVIDTQNAAPITSLVIGASPEFFRPDGGPPGSEDPERLASWVQATTQWLSKEFGTDAAHVSLHLDEETPHIHVHVVPIVSRNGIGRAPLVSHHKHPAFAGRRSYAALLDRYADAVGHLGIERGDPMPDEAKGLSQASARDWTRTQAHDVRKSLAAREAVVGAWADDLARRETDLAKAAHAVVSDARRVNAAISQATHDAMTPSAPSVPRRQETRARRRPREVTDDQRLQDPR